MIITCQTSRAGCAISGCTAAICSACTILRTAGQSSLVYCSGRVPFTGVCHQNRPALGFGSQVPELAKLPPLTIWSELLGAFLWQALLFWALDLSAAGYLLCLWAFALHWSALQYADHAGAAAM